MIMVVVFDTLGIVLHSVSKCIHDDGGGGFSEQFSNIGSKCFHVAGR